MNELLFDLINLFRMTDLNGFPYTILEPSLGVMF